MDAETTAYLAQAAMTWATLYATHLLGDHAMQKSTWAAAKHHPGTEGRAACATHVTGLTVTQLVGLALVAVITGAGYLPAAAAAGLAPNAWSHYWFDRRFTAAGLYTALDKVKFAALGVPREHRDDSPCLGTGAYRMDQDWHIAWLIPVALIVAAPSLAHAALPALLGAAAMAAAITASRRQRTSRPESASRVEEHR